MDDNNISTISVVRISSPTPSPKKKENNKKSSTTNKNETQTTKNDDLLSKFEFSSDKNENQDGGDEDEEEKEEREVIGLTIEEFYPPEEAKKLAKEILNYAGASSPLHVDVDLEFQKYVIQNDHCYTPYTSPSQVKGIKNSVNSATSILESSHLASNSGDNVSIDNIKPIIQKKIPTISNNEKQKVGVGTEKSFNVDEKESEADDEEYSEYTESSFSESDNDRDSDLDFDVNGRGKRKKPKKRGKIGRKITKKRQSSSTANEKEDDEKKISHKSQHHKQSIETKKSQHSLTTASIPSIGSSPMTSNSKTAIKVYPVNKNQTKGIHIISQHPVLELSATKEQSKQQQQVTDPNRSLLKGAHTLKKEKKSEGVFTEISKFIRQGESSKPNLKVIQLKSDKTQQVSKLIHRQPQTQIATTSKGFMPLGVEAAAKNQLPAQISIQTHQSSTELTAENDKQLDLIDSIVKDEMKNSSIIVKDTMNENIPQLVKMLENTESTVYGKSKIGSINATSTYTHSVEDIDIASAQLLENAEDDIPEDLLQHVVELMDNKTIQEVIDKEVLNSGQSVVPSPTITTSRPTQLTTTELNHFGTTASHNFLLQDSSMNSNISEIRNHPKKESIEIIRRDGRVIKLPPIEAPTTRAKRRAQTQGTATNTTAKETSGISILKPTVGTNKTQQGSNSRRNSANEQKTNARKRESVSSSQRASKESENEEDEDSSGESEDDPNKLWCICRQPHNNRFMICCDVCEDWFHGTCVNITKAMGIEMELKGIEWTCPKCQKKGDPESKKTIQKRINEIFKKKSQPESIEQHQVGDIKKLVATDDISSVKKLELNKKNETTIKQKSNDNSQKKNQNDSKKSSNTDLVQRKITDIMKSSEFVQQKKSSLSMTETKSAAEVTETKLVHKVQMKSAEVQQKKLSQKEDSIQKKMNQSIESNQRKSIDETFVNSGIRLKADKLEKQQQKNDSAEANEDDRNCIVCKKKARPNSIYCSHDCIRRHAQSARISSKVSTTVTTTPPQDDKKKKNSSSFEEALAKASETTLQIKNKIERVYVYERKTGRLLTGSNAPTTANLKKWLQDNPTFEIVQPGSPQLLAIERSKQKQKLAAINTPTNSNEQNLVKTTISPTMTQMALPTKQKLIQIEMQLLKSSTPKLKKISQMNATTVKLLSSNGEPKATTTTTMIPNRGDYSEGTSREERESMKKDKKETNKEKETKNLIKIKKQSSIEQIKGSSSTQNQSSSSPVTINEIDNVRSNIKRTLKEHLLVRMNEMEDNDAPKLTEQEIEEFANETENEMYKLFNNDVGAKYKSKYRSLMFNIKDKKNKTLYYKIFGKQIEPKQFVRMSPEDLASQELAQWRQNENKHQLEMIKKSELDLLSCKKNYVLKTHKGEEVIESKITDQLSLDITIPVEDVVTVLNSSTVSSTSELMESVSSTDKEKEHHKVSSSHDLPFDNVSLQDSDMTTKEKTSIISTVPTSTTIEKKKIYKSGVGGSSRDRDRDNERDHERERNRDRDRDRDHDRHHKQKDKHKHNRKRSRSRSRSRERKHRGRSLGHEEKRNRIEKDRSTDNQKKDKTETTKEKDKIITVKENYRDESANKEKVPIPLEKQESKSKQSTNKSSTSQTIKSKDKEVKLAKSSAIKTESTLNPDNCNLIDKILESTKTIEEAANLIVTDDKDKDKEKEKEKDNETEKDNEIEKEKEKQNIDYTKTHSFEAKSKLSEVNTNSTDSDQEPSSTVTIATPPEDQYLRYSSDIALILWSGSINMIDVATFQIVLQPVIGTCDELGKELPSELDVVGRISPETVWEYIAKIKKSPNKEIVIIRLVPAYEAENIAYTALYTYLDKRSRLGVIKTTSPHLKDFYILPLGSNKQLPSVLQPPANSKIPDLLEDDTRPDLLMGIVIRIMKKRSSTLSTGTTSISRGLHPPTKIRKMESTSSSVIPSHIQALDEDHCTPPNSPKRMVIESKVNATSKILSAGRLPPKTSDDPIDIDVILPSSVKLNETYDNADDEPYSPGGSSDDDLTSIPNTSIIDTSTATPDDLKRKMDEINRQIEAQKMEIAGMLNLDQSKNYSAGPSVDLSPALANISIPSNLHQILASIKQTPSSTASSSALTTEPKTMSSAPYITSSSSLSSNNTASIPSLSTTFPSTSLSDSSTIPPPPIIGSLSLLNNSLNSDELEEYVPGPVIAKNPEVKDHTSLEKKESLENSSLDASKNPSAIETFTHDVDLRVEYPQLSKKPRWDQINNPPPPGLEDEYS